MEEEPQAVTLPGPGDRATARGLELLLSILSQDELEAADKYETLRLKTLRFFQWKGASDADELTDETLVRVGRKLGEGVPVGKAELAPYVRGVARMVYLEALRSQERDRRLRESVAAVPTQSTEPDELRIRCLETCLAGLDEDTRTLILDYYADVGAGKIAKRKSIASELGISMTALRIRAHRLRERLFVMVSRCVEESAG